MEEKVFFEYKKNIYLLAESPAIQDPILLKKIVLKRLNYTIFLHLKILLCF